MSKADYRDVILLQQILDAIDNVMLHQQSTVPHLTVLHATIYELITIGEAVGSLSETIKSNYREVPWQKIKDSRNKMVHDYENISELVVMDIVRNHLPVLKNNIMYILKQIQQ